MKIANIILNKTPQEREFVCRNRESYAYGIDTPYDYRCEEYEERIADIW